MGSKIADTAPPSGGLQRVIIKNIRPSVAGGQYPAKGTEGIPVVFKANIIADGHDKLYARVLYKVREEKNWKAIPMRLTGNDGWEARITPEKTGIIEFRVQAWVSALDSWKDAWTKKQEAGADTKPDDFKGLDLLAHLADLAAKTDQKEIRRLLAMHQENGITPEAVDPALYDKLLQLAPKTHISSSESFCIDVERKKALFSTWYELFPRSCATQEGSHGTFSDVIRYLPRLADAGFDILYLPPIHPIGRLKRKGKNNSLVASSVDPGSPWAIGSDEGGHKALHPELGTMEDFKKLVKEAKKQGMEIAMDIAFQCAPDHPYVQQHPEWFKWRTDGTVQFAENPPKKYEDILPFDFESEVWASLWEELLSIFMFWIGKGVKVFRVDNPHTKSLRLWEWIIATVRKEYPEVLFLAEAFTRPHIMEHLAMAGFTQSYTYFTWRNSKQELQEYVTELTKGEKQYFFRPSFWPNTPDILPEHLVTGGDNMHIIRALLAATLSSSYGIYGPVYERGINTPMPGKEEYIDNEKYEIKHWEPVEENRIWKAIKAINLIRKHFTALQMTNNIEFLNTSNDQIMAYLKHDPLQQQHLLIVITLDPHQTQSGWINIPLEKLQKTFGAPLKVYDELNKEEYDWNKDWNYAELDPGHKPAHIFRFVPTH